jgi:hypothetical protein
MVLVAVFAVARLENAACFQFSEAAAQECPRHPWHAAMDFVETRAAAKQLSKDQRCPAFRKHLRAFRKRTVLTIAMHAGVPPEE